MELALETSLPLPVAALLRRVVNAKSPKERHDTAYYAWEASVRIAVAARPPESLAALEMPSTGNWVGAMSKGEGITESTAILGLHSLMSSVALDKNVSPRAITIQNLFDLLPAYRNKVIGHAATRSSAFYREAAPKLRDACLAAWAEGFFLGKGEQLVFVESVDLASDGSHRARIFSLSGLAPRLEEMRAALAADGSVLPRRLYVRAGGDSYRSVQPWLLYDDSEEFRERVLFFNGMGRTPRYLDYLSGEELKGKRLGELFPETTGDLAKLFSGGSAQYAEPGPSTEDRFGDYKILGKIGEGGMGIVYLALQESLQRVVAIKTLPPAATEDPVAVARFKREISALSRCDHPNVVKILASGEVTGSPLGSLYYAMEFVDGPDLARLGRALSGAVEFDEAVSTASEQLRSQRSEILDRMPVLRSGTDAGKLVDGSGDRIGSLVSTFKSAALALHHLHELGIVHRDIKPANLMLTSSDHRVVVMDLGLAALGDASRTITRHDAGLLGTLRYMAPEQLHGKLQEVDRRADVYALGATFYELLTGRTFFDGETEARLIEQVLHEEPLDPRRANRRLPRDLCTILSKAFSKDRRQRYDTAEALAQDLDAFVNGRPISARPPTAGYLLGLAIRKNKGLSATVGITVALAVFSAVFFLFWEKAKTAEAIGQRDEIQRQKQAKDQAMLDLFREQGRLELLSGDASKAVVYLSEAYQTSAGEDDPALRFLLAEALSELEAFVVPLEGDYAEPVCADFSPGGGRVVTAHADGSAYVWDSYRGEL